MELPEPKKLDFELKGQPVKARIYVHEPTASTKVEISGVDLSQPLNYTQLYALRELVSDLMLEAELMERAYG